MYEMVGYVPYSRSPKTSLGRYINPSIMNYESNSTVYQIINVVTGEQEIKKVKKEHSISNFQSQNLKIAANLPDISRNHKIQ